MSSSKVPSASPTYHAPKKGLLSYLPQSCVPYGELIRLDKGGYSNVMSHLASGALMAASMQSAPAGQVLSRLSLLLAAFIPVRYINFAWNDTVDADIDRLVPRTQVRPIARGALSRRNASIFTCGLAVLIWAELWYAPAVFSVYAVPFTLVALIYPFSKRFTDCPQLIFGLLVAQTSIMGAALLGETPFISTQCKSLLGNPRHCVQPQLHFDDHPFLTLFVANVIWAVFYETIYSFADVRDDAKAGIRTITLRIRGHAKLVLSVLAFSLLGLLALVGYQTRFSEVYFIATLGGTGIVTAIQIKHVNLGDPRSCLWWFSEGNKMLGTAIVGGFAAEYCRRMMH